jgi:D-lactate dehydrogenase (cytochrome)
LLCHLRDDWFSKHPPFRQNAAVSNLVSSSSTAVAVEQIKAVLGDRLSVNYALREQHGRDLTWHEPHAPDAVAFPQSTDEVVRIVGSSEW